jgi:hypothetical protein
MQALRLSDTSWRVVRHHRADETRVSPRQQGYCHRVVNEVVTRGNRHQEARFDRASPRLPVQLAVAVGVGQPLAAFLAVGHDLSARGGEPFQSPHCASHPRQAPQQSCGRALPPPKGASAAPFAARPTLKRGHSLAENAATAVGSEDCRAGRSGLRGTLPQDLSRDKVALMRSGSLRCC